MRRVRWGQIQGQEGSKLLGAKENRPVTSRKEIKSYDPGNKNFDNVGATYVPGIIEVVLLKKKKNPHVQILDH